MIWNYIETFKLVYLIFGYNDTSVTFVCYFFVVCLLFMWDKAQLTNTHLKVAKSKNNQLPNKYCITINLSFQFNDFLKNENYYL